jgi:signal peptidase I
VARIKPSSGIYEYIKSLGIALLLAYLIKTSIVEAYKIPSSSMEDTLLVGDFLLANKFIYGAQVPFTDWHLPAVKDPQPGDVVIFRWPLDPSTNYIKRCVATAGQVVEIRDKVLYVDGSRFLDPENTKYTDRRVITDPAVGRDNFGPYRVPPGMIFAMGDNRDNSSDSRFWGPVSLNLVQGKAVLIHWSWQPDIKAPEITLTDLGSIPRSVAYNLIHFFRRVRWSRLGNFIE